VQEELREEGPLLRPAERERTPVGDRLNRSKYAEFHESVAP